MSNNKKNNKKYIIALCIVLYAVLLTVVFFKEKSDVAKKEALIQAESQAAEEQKKEQEAVNKEDAVKAKGKMYEDAYNKVIAALDYDYNNAAVKIKEQDCISIIEDNKLPALERMSAEDSEKLMSELQVLKKIEALKIDTKSFETPELNWKNLYNKVSQDMGKNNTFANQIKFSGNKSSELNALISQSNDAYITITSKELILDETITMKSGIGLDAEGVEIKAGENELDKAVFAENCDKIAIKNFEMKNGGYKYGLYLIKCNNFDIENNSVSKAVLKALVVMGTCKDFIIKDNEITENGNGSVFLNGDISNGIIENNNVYNNSGARNLTAGIVMTSMTIDDYYTAYNDFKDEHLYDLLEEPHDIVLRKNNVQYNHSSGIYSDGAYKIYIIENTILQNDKEGMCLDYGTFGAYVSNNIIKENGGRLRQTDEDLTADFIISHGRLEDGSSPAKLPGVSIDNSAYNIVSNNNVTSNYGSGIKMVRSGYRNIIIENTVAHNNRGKSDEFHFFGIELGYASTPDEPVKGLDFTATYENIICRNVVTGRNYAGIYLGPESYCNDLFDNIIMDSEWFSIECHSDKFNSMVNNTMNQDVLNLFIK